MPRPGPHLGSSRSRPTTSLAFFASLLVGLATAPACVRGTASGAPTTASGAATPEAVNLKAERRLQGVARMDLLGPRALAAFQLEGHTRKVTLTMIPVEGQQFSTALRAAITEASGSEWTVQLVAPNAQPIEKGDVILATFHLRGPKPPQDTPLAQTELVVDLGRAPYASRFNTRFRSAARGQRSTSASRRRRPMPPERHT